MNKEMKMENNVPRDLGLFLLTLGIILLIAFLDVFSWGPPSMYFRWEMLLILFGTGMLLRGNLPAALFLLAAGTWFMLPDINIYISPTIRKIFWHSVLILGGLLIIIQPPRRRRAKDSNDNF